jgi:hypothetical protein
MSKTTWAVRVLATLVSFLLLIGSSANAEEPVDGFRLATFTIDATIPLNHRCMGVLPTKSKKIVDPLFVHGMALLGNEKPIVICAIDWCEVRNGAYDQWRAALAKAAGTSVERVLVCSLHQHDAPVTDLDAAKILEQVGLAGELYDVAFHEATVARAAKALKDAVDQARPITHFGIGKAKVHQVASNRRVVHPDGRVSFSRGSRSGSSKFHSQAPDGLIDPYIRTIRFYAGDKPLLSLHSYATHPMSYYGRGGVTSDFVGLARERRLRDDNSIRQIYVSGCSGDVTAGKYNNGSQESREALTDRMYDAIVRSEANAKRIPLSQVALRNTKLSLPFHPKAALKAEALEAKVNNKDLRVEDRILAAMGLASRRRVAKGQLIDFPCVDLGAAQIVLFPGESFVGYQRMAQEMAPHSFVMSIGYGECWPGYVPTKAAFDDKFGDNWLWVGPGSEAQIRGALKRVLK